MPKTLFSETKDDHIFERMMQEKPNFNKDRDNDKDCPHCIHYDEKCSLDDCQYTDKTA